MPPEITLHHLHLINFLSSAIPIQISKVEVLIAQLKVWSWNLVWILDICNSQGSFLDNVKQYYHTCTKSL